MELHEEWLRLRQNKFWWLPPFFLDLQAIEREAEGLGCAWLANPWADEPEVFGTWVELIDLGNINGSFAGKRMAGVTVAVDGEEQPTDIGGRAGPWEDLTEAQHFATLGDDVDTHDVDKITHDGFMVQGKVEIRAPVPRSGVVQLSVHEKALEEEVGVPGSFTARVSLTYPQGVDKREAIVQVVTPTNRAKVAGGITVGGVIELPFDYWTSTLVRIEAMSQDGLYDGSLEAFTPSEPGPFEVVVPMTQAGEPPPGGGEPPRPNVAAMSDPRVPVAPPPLSPTLASPGEVGPAKGEGGGDDGGGDDGGAGPTPTVKPPGGTPEGA